MKKQTQRQRWAATQQRALNVLAEIRSDVARLAAAPALGGRRRPQALEAVARALGLVESVAETLGAAVCAQAAAVRRELERLRA